MANNPSSPSNGDMPFSVDLDNYDDADVVSFDSTVMHKIGKVKAAIKSMSCSRRGTLDSYLYNEFKTSLGTSNGWVAGTNCEILKVGGKDWKKGKIKVEITVKFYPDEPEIEEVNQAEPSLDSMRLTMDKWR